MPINYDNRAFRGRVNTDNGEVSDVTRFHYRQDGARLWASYSGGSVITGHLLGHVNEDDSLEFVYHHINVDGELMAGRCCSTPTIESDGRLVMNESWQWMTGDQSAGTSQVEEVKDEA